MGSEMCIRDRVQTIFIQDFLPLSHPRKPSSKGQDFTSRFKHLFVQLKVHKALRHLISAHPFGSQTNFTPNEAFEDMSKWDWSKVRVSLVMSVPGNHEGVTKMEDFGLCRLGKVVEEEGWTCGKGEMVKAEFQVRAFVQGLRQRVEICGLRDVMMKSEKKN